MYSANHNLGKLLMNKLNNLNRKRHWDNIYQSKNTNEVSWYQPIPTASIDFVKHFNLAKNAKIIDIGGGDDFLVDHLLKLGYLDITVLDISEKATERAKQRLGHQADAAKWINADIVNFYAIEKYDFWHDRAAFQFLTDEKEIENYLNTVNKSIKPKGYILIGAFSEQGPTQCSGIDIRQYSENSLTDWLRHFYMKLKCITIDHKTPSGSIQNFIFCSFRRIETAWKKSIEPPILASALLHVPQSRRQHSRPDVDDQPTMILHHTYLQPVR